MSDIVIRAEGLGKKYLIGHQIERERYTALRDVLARNARDYWRKAKALAHGEPIMPGDEQEEIWALRDVSFEIRQGEAVGIIGRNGAGKSTLLKILSRITEPSAGRVTIKGRVASLLEVGTGFHPELTGRENIYLNGAILGMTRQEIKHKFDEIVDFAEVEKFLDTPVKRYSSGMYVRLAFAVAAHLEPEILVVDEVLAVGDAAFQKKCLGKMGDVSKNGKTVIFVSHNMGAVSELCNSALVINKGDIFYRGNVIESISQYMNILSDIFVTSRELATWTNRTGSGEARILNVFLDWINRGEKKGCLSMGDSLIITFDVVCSSALNPCKLRFSVAIKTITGIKTLHVANEDDSFSFPKATKARISVNFPELKLYPGIYSLSLWVGSSQYVDYDYIQDCLHFEVAQSNWLPRSFKIDWSQGLVFHESRWSYDEYTY